MGFLYLKEEFFVLFKISITIVCMPFANMSSYFFCLEQGLKTGMYYLRTRPAADPIKFTLDKQKAQQATTTTAANPVSESDKAANEAAMLCSIENKEACLSCSG